MATVNNVASPFAPMWKKFTIPFASVQAAALTNAVTIYTLPKFGVVHAAKMNVATAFSGGAIATITASVGTAGSPAKYLVATTVAGTGSTDGVSLAIPALESTSGTTAVQVSFTSTIANLSALTQGSMDIYLLVSQMQ